VPVDVNVGEPVLPAHQKLITGVVAGADPAKTVWLLGARLEA